MARIAGVDLPRNKRMEIALTYIYGIGKTSAGKILDQAGINRDKSSDEITEGEVSKIRDILDKNFNGIAYF